MSTIAPTLAPAVNLGDFWTTEEVGGKTCWVFNPSGGTEMRLSAKHAGRVAGGVALAILHPERVDVENGIVYSSSDENLRYRFDRRKGLMVEEQAFPQPGGGRRWLPTNRLDAGYYHDGNASNGISYQVTGAYVALLTLALGIRWVVEHDEKHVNAVMRHMDPAQAGTGLDW